MSAWGELRSSVLARIKPGPDEAAEVRALVEAVARRLSEHLREAGVESTVEAHGSVAHDTWLRDEHDADLLILVPPSGERPALLGVVEEVKRFLGAGWVEAYAEHPYVQSEIGGMRIDFVPCFRIQEGETIRSATDRTPLHTRFLRGRLDGEKRDEVRLLKQFLRGVGVYGAEIKVGGFSGYLAELLILSYGSLLRTLEAASVWTGSQVVPTTGSDLAGLRRRFNEPLIVVDPVDETRNVASAVSETAMWSLCEASRAFLAAPSAGFFFPPAEAVDRPGLLRSLGERGVDTVFVSVPDGEPDVPDTLWGQLYKAEKALSRALRDRGFSVTRSAAWSDEKTRHVFVLEMESRSLPPAVKRVGPRVELRSDGDNFREAYAGSPGTVAGPGVEGDRWWVIVRRQHTDAVEYLERALVDGGVEIGVPKRLADKIKAGKSIRRNEGAEPLLCGGFDSFLQRFLRGRPAWLD